MGKLLKVAVVLLVVAVASCGGKRKSYKAEYQPREYKFPQQFIEVNNVKLSYIEAGSGDQTILFVHGVGGSLNNWDYNFEYFAARYHALALDLPGHGNSERPDLPYTIDMHVDFIHQFLVEKGIKKAVIVGHSVGGQAAVVLQLKYPEMVERLVLVAPSGADVYMTSGLNWIGSRQYVRRSVMTMANASRAPYKTYERLVWNYLERDGKHGYYSSLVYDANSYPTKEFLQSEMKYYYNFMKTPEFIGFVRAIRKTASSVPRGFVRDDLHNVDVPTLIVWGKYDGIVPFENACVFNDLIPVSMLAILPDAGHMPMVEKPDRFNRIVNEFLK